MLHWFHFLGLVETATTDLEEKGKKRNGKRRCLMKVENRLIYSAITFEIHLLNHHYHFVKVRWKKFERKNGKILFHHHQRSAQSSFYVLKTAAKKVEFNLKTGDENSCNIRFDFSILAYTFLRVVVLQSWWFVQSLPDSHFSTTQINATCFCLF